MTTDKGDKLILTFRGVRGSYPVPGKKTREYGGNTPCLQFAAGNKNIILDAGTGICQLGRELQSKDIDIFITHLHWDHIMGFPYFAPIYDESCHINVFAPEGAVASFKLLMNKPFFPLKLAEIKAEVNFEEIAASEIKEITEKNNFTVKTFSGFHTGKNLIYKICWQDKSCVYLGDYEHQDENLEDHEFLQFLNGTDLLIYDAHFIDDEYNGLSGSPSKKGWGHSTWEEGIKLACRVKAKSLAFFHHAPERTDKELKELESWAKGELATSFAAKEGLCFKF